MAAIEREREKCATRGGEQRRGELPWPPAKELTRAWESFDCGDVPDQEVFKEMEGGLAHSPWDLALTCVRWRRPWAHRGGDGGTVTRTGDGANEIGAKTARKLAMETVMLCEASFCMGAALCNLASPMTGL